MMRYAFLMLLGCAGIALAKPNVVYILADDLGYGEVGYNGQEKIQTPELDAMAAKGMRFTDHYCGNSVCAPSRCSLMTGLHPGHAYIRANSPGYPGGQTPLPKGTETMGKLMQRAGYKTAIIGKWGLGSTWDSGHPNQQGFDHFFGYTDQRKAHNYYPEYLWRNSDKLMLDNGKGKKNDYSHDLMTVEALKFIDENQKKPFFLYLAYTIPHISYQVPDLAQYKDKDWPKNMKIHAAMTSRMDRDIGAIKRRLEELGLAENTLITFNSDNGAHGQFGSLEFFKTSGKLRGKKRLMYEGGVRSPMIAYWPGKVPAGTVNDHISAFWDMLPTLAELTGEPVQGKTDGISMLPALLGRNDKQQKHKYLYWELYEGSPNQAVRFGKWKGVVADRRKGMKIELYDVTSDEGEQADVASEHPEVVEKIRQMMKDARVPSPYWDKDNKPLFNAKAACDANGVEPLPPRQKNKKKK
ncbi:arylsulfatase [Pontiella sulfatireligans]|uniref:Arylsulfatase n=1 Tax=Pontiella sulfatireligans TaxID=2750658 RepID=A0A6C2UKH3_9BACT|nr:arylsulfatase [Pontiella sulfatireligans]SPS74401.1 sulfatase S1_20 [Kiritimatiellales bacterium]VGO20383.1 Arylsulfatase [Pontiella sulfatireligans]